MVFLKSLAFRSSTARSLLGFVYPFLHLQSLIQL